jgi:hypothetical protein
MKNIEVYTNFMKSSFTKSFPFEGTTKQCLPNYLILVLLVLSSIVALVARLILAATLPFCVLRFSSFLLRVTNGSEGLSSKVGNILIGCTEKAGANAAIPGKCCDWLFKTKDLKHVSLIPRRIDAVLTHSLSLF